MPSIGVSAIVVMRQLCFPEIFGKVTRHYNSLSPTPTKANKSGVVGVNWDKSRNKWQASIRFKGHKYNLGRFTNTQDAIDIRKKPNKRFLVSF